MHWHDWACICRFQHLVWCFGNLSPCLDLKSGIFCHSHALATPEVRENVVWSSDARSTLHSEDDIDDVTLTLVKQRSISNDVFKKATNNLLVAPMKTFKSVLNVWLVHAAQKMSLRQAVTYWRKALTSKENDVIVCGTLSGNPSTESGLEGRRPQ